MWLSAKVADGYSIKINFLVKQVWNSNFWFTWIVYQIFVEGDLCLLTVKYDGKYSLMLLHAIEFNDERKLGQ